MIPASAMVAITVFSCRVRATRGGIGRKAQNDCEMCGAGVMRGPGLDCFLSDGFDAGFTDGCVAACQQFCCRLLRGLGEQHERAAVDAVGLPGAPINQANGAVLPKGCGHA